jgi:type IV pilus assembly protein PilW
MNRISIPGSMRRAAGLSLIELMIAMVLGLLVAAGIVSVFQSTSGSNRVQRQLAVLQEEGRFAITRMKDDLSLANSQYCSNTGGTAGVTDAGVSLDALRSPTIYANASGAIAGAMYDLTTTVPDATTASSLPSYLYMRGYDCTTTGCDPVDPNTAHLSAETPIPAQGTAVGKRVLGSSVLTVRYLDPTKGWAINPNGSATGSTIQSSNGTLLEIDLQKGPGDKTDPTDPKNFAANDLALYTDCSTGEIFAQTGAGTAVMKPAAANSAQPGDLGAGNPGANAPKLFDFNKDFNTVTYWVEVMDNGNGGTTGALMRRVNGVNSELVRGVERLDFKYGVINANGLTEFLSAKQVDTATDGAGNSIPCPPGVSLVGVMPTTGCLWRAVKTIQVNLLMDGQTPLYTLSTDEMKYIYTADPNAKSYPISPSSYAVTAAAQGFPDQLLRREFTTLVSLRNYNP